ncbi:hypothetical protein HanRHA438_Chr05g0238751 [Helianthus annuus]|nr:hypothetical protein HanIR_Chr02g0072521 [Helianthus annuus]KAJ0920201.1 hypothetical protein HanRHA438_Chr05g0238751 [Helianthus annuus]
MSSKVNVQHSIFCQEIHLELKHYVHTSYRRGIKSRQHPWLNIIRSYIIRYFSLFLYGI